MSSLRPLDADRLQTDCPRILLTVRTAGYFLKGAFTIGLIPRVLAWPHSCVSAAKILLLHCLPQCTASYVRGPEPLSSPSRRIPAYTEASVKFCDSTKTRLNLHTRHAPPAASS